jgi:hypothetical protein
MIDNLHLIKPLLKFDKKGDFYHIIILERKKDKPIVKQNDHQSARTVKTYCIDSIEKLDSVYDKIKIYCESFEARAYILLEKLNHERITLYILKVLAERQLSGHYMNEFIFDSALSHYLKSTKPKYWLIDIDCMTDDEINFIIDTITNTPPVGNKIIATIPTKQGVHLITKKFWREKFNDVIFGCEPKINAPTLLYYPNSIKNNLET